MKVLQVELENSVSHTLTPVSYWTSYQWHQL